MSCAVAPTWQCNDACLDAYAELRAHQRQNGATIGANDLQIAAIALTHALQLVSDDRAAFERIPGLRLVSWRRDLAESAAHPAITPVRVGRQCAAGRVVRLDLGCNALGFRGSRESQR